MNKKYLRNSNIDEDIVEGKDVLDFSVRTKNSHLFTVHINTEIREPAYYSKVFDLLLDAGEEDTVQMFIASPGGRLDGLNILLEGIRMTDAHVVGVILGEAHSAAAILALHCHETVVTSSAEMLVHGIRYATGGKSADIHAHVTHTNKIAEKLFRETFEGYLSPAEILLVLEGKEMFLDSEDITARLAARQEYFTNLQEIQENEDKPVTIEGTPDVLPTDGRGKGKKKQSPAAA